MKIKSLILLFIISLFIIGGCSSPQPIEPPDLNSIIKNQLESKELQISELLVNQKLIGFLGIFIFAIFIGLIIIFLGLKKVGIALVISAIVSISLILGLSIYTKYVALIGIGCIITGIIFLFREIYYKNRFETDLVTTVELAKNKISTANKLIFKKELDNLQNKNTKKKVLEIKKKT